MKVYDCFNFFNELDLLEIRLIELYDAVDVFVIAEATVTFQGNAKALIFQDHKFRFQRFADKIRHIVIDDTPDTNNPWDRETYQRNCLVRGLHDADPDDHVMIADVDEIPSVAAVQEAVRRKHLCYFTLPLFYHCLNLALDNPERPRWSVSYMAPAVTFVRETPNSVRTEGDRCFFERQIDPAQGILDLGGWHFSSTGGVDAVMTKLSAFSHTEPEVVALNNRDVLQEHFENRTLFFSGERLRNVSPLHGFPKAIQRNPEHYADIGFLTEDWREGERYSPPTR